MPDEPQPESTKKPRGPNKRARRNYATELADLQSRVNIAVLALGKVTGSEMVSFAVEVLQGE